MPWTAKVQIRIGMEFAYWKCHDGIYQERII